MTAPRPLLLFALAAPPLLAQAGDPLAIRGRTLTPVERQADVKLERKLELDAGALRLSPTAARWALSRVDGGRTTFIVSGASGSPHEVAAEDVAFAGETRLLAVEDGADALTLAEYSLHGRAQRAGETALPPLDGPVLAAAASGAWSVTGVDVKTRELVEVHGRAAQERTSETRWRGPAGASSIPFSAWAVGEGAALDVERKVGRRPGVVADAEELPPWHSVLYLLEGRSSHAVASTSLPVRCRARSGSDAFLCVAVGSDATHVWSVRPGDDEPRPVASLRGRAVLEEVGPDGVLALWLGDDGLVLLDPRTRSAVRLKLPGEDGERRRVTALAVTTDAVGLVTRSGSGSTLLVVSR
jgi:hypothetical protein